jgi:hypothetical protein
MSALWVYVFTFILTTYPPNLADSHRLFEMSAISWEIAHTDCAPEECLVLANIPRWESGYERRAVGKMGERGAWQIMPPASSYGAKEALRRLRVQGIRGYCGCTERRPCPEMVERRVGPARVWYATHPFDGFDEGT